MAGRGHADPLMWPRSVSEWLPTIGLGRRAASGGVEDAAHDPPVLADLADALESVISKRKRPCAVRPALEAAAAGVVEATPAPARTSGDPALLERLALNLVQNGVRHIHAAGWAWVETGASVRPEWVCPMAARSLRRLGKAAAW
jgi:hypothetical protein